MNKQVCKTLVGVTLLAMLAVVPIYAQSSGTLVANVPFNFMVGKTVLPSGEYTVKSLSPAAIQIQSRDSLDTAVVLTMAVHSLKLPEAGKLVFSRYGDQYFLSKIWHPANSTGRELIKSRAEIELAKNMSKPEAIVLAAKK